MTTDDPTAEDADPDGGQDLTAPGRQDPGGTPLTLEDARTADRRLLAYLGTAMIATGQPVHEIEEELYAVAAHLGHPGAQIAAGPTGITLNLASGEPGTYESVNGSLRLDQSADVRVIRHHLLTDELTPGEAFGRLLALRTKPPRYPRWMTNVGWVGIAVGIALILQPGLRNVIAAAVCSIVVLVLMRISQRNELLATLLPTVAAFVVSVIVFTAANAQLLDGPLRTVLPPLAVLLPGALMVTGMSELAAGDMMAGSARLVFGLVQLLLFTLGLIAASRLVSLPTSELGNVRVDTLGWWAAPLGLLVISGGICLLESAPVRLLPWIALVLVVTFSAQIAGQSLGGAALGSFLGAMAASVGASLVEAFRPRLPRLVVFLPSFWLLVPGSLGLLGVTQLVVDPEQALAVGFDVFTVVCAIALGLLVGTAIARSSRTLIRRLRRLGRLKPAL